jgi:hypothetical protein
MREELKQVEELCRAFPKLENGMTRFDVFVPQTSGRSNDPALLCVSDHAKHLAWVFRFQSRGDGGKWIVRCMTTEQRFGCSAGELLETFKTKLEV